MSALIVPEWRAPANVVAATTTRSTPDNALPTGIRFLNQVHGMDVVSVDALRA